MEENKDILTEEEVKDEVESTVEEAGEEAETVADEAGKVVAEEVEAAADEAGEAVAEEVEAAADEAGETSSSKSPVIVKKKKKVNMTSLITIIICVVIVLACLVFMAVKLGWFKKLMPSEPKITMGDYSVIEVSSEYETVDPDIVQESIDSMLADYATTEEVTEGTVAEGDTINIDYVGVYADGDDAGVEFDGGSAEDYDYEVGSEGILFDADLVGLEVGSTTEIPVTFPDDYSEESLQGVNTIFTVTVNCIKVTIEQEFTDEWAEEYSEKYFEETLSTAEEFREYVTQTYYTTYLHTAMFDYLVGLAEITSYDEEMHDLFVGYYEDQLEYYASYYGVDADTYATYMGFSSADDCATSYGEYYLDSKMIVDYVCDDLGIEGTDEGLDESLENDMKLYGYTDSYTVEEYKEQMGDAWVLMYDALNYRYELALDALEDRVVFVEPETEAEVETEVESETAE